MSTFEYQVVGVERVKAKLNPAKALAHVSRAIIGSGGDALRELKSNTPRATGSTQRTENVQMAGSPPLKAIIGSHAGYFGALEKGRKPGRPPPVEALRPWLRARGIPQTAAYQVARSIGQHGTKGAFMVQKTFEKVPGIVNRHLATAAKRIEAEFAK